jgi:rhamnulokinase
MSKHYFLAFDLGAESGKAILGTLENKKLDIREIHRFSNGMVQIQGHFYWDILRLFEKMKESLSICAREGIPIESMAVDTWGVDFVLLAEDGSILGAPYAYRDPRTNHAMEQLFKIIPKNEVYKSTGIQFMQFNSIFQLFSMKRDNSPLLKIAKDLLFIPDIFNYMFTGVKKSEFSFATTSQMFNPLKHKWEESFFNALDLPISLMQSIVMPGTIIGNLNDDICDQICMKKIPVIAVASHDTGSAFAAIPAEGSNWAVISSGTWSVLGIETKTPIINQKALELNFTNEGGVDHTFRFLKNIMGLWLIQQCKKKWDCQNKNFSYSELVRMGEDSPAFQSWVNPDAPEFLNPPDMTETISAFCHKTGQKIPSTMGGFVRTIMESLAFKYRVVLDELKQVSQNTIEKIHIIGGGIQNEFLCQLTANATGLPVITGPVEATAIGNLLVQALAMGHLNSLADIRQIVLNNFAIKTYRPQNTDDWNNHYKVFQSLLKK